MTRPEAGRLPALVLTLAAAIVSLGVAAVVSANGGPSEGAMSPNTSVDEPTPTAVPIPPGYVQQPPYLGNCPAQPLVCIGFSDGYTWLVSNSIQGRPWRFAVDPRPSGEAVGLDASAVGDGDQPQAVDVGRGAGTQLR